MADYAPASGNSAGRVKRATRACNHCRWKRLKCSDQAENESCMNCLIYGVNCEYTSTWPSQNAKRKDRNERTCLAGKPRKKPRPDTVNTRARSSPSVPNVAGTFERIEAGCPEDERTNAFGSPHPQRADSVYQRTSPEQEHGTPQAHDKLGREMVHYLIAVMSGVTEAESVLATEEPQGLPPEPITFALVDAYFDHIAPLYPILDEKEFRSQLADYLRTNQQPDLPWPSLVKMVLAVGAAAIRDRSDAVGNLAHIRERLAKEVMAASYLVYCSNKLRNCQLLVLLTIYFMQMKKLQGAWLWCRWGVRMLRTQVGRKERPQLINETQDDQKSKDILGWTLFIIESQLSVIQYRDDPRMSESMLKQPGDHIRRKLPVLCYRLDLARISRKMCGIEDTNPDAATFARKIQETYDSIAAWKKSLPEEYRPESRTVGDSAEYKAVLYMHTEYHTLLLSIFTALGASSRILSKDTDQQANGDQAARNQLALCVNNARHLLRTIHAITEATHIKPCVTSILNMVQLLSPFSLIYGQIVRKPGLTSAPKDLEILRKVLQVNKEFMSIAPQHEHISSLLHAMYSTATDSIVREKEKQGRLATQDRSATQPVNTNYTHEPVNVAYAPALQDDPLVGLAPGQDFNYSPTFPIAMLHPNSMALISDHDLSAYAYQMDVFGAYPLQNGFRSEQEAAATAWMAAQQSCMMP